MYILGSLGLGMMDLQVLKRPLQSTRAAPDRQDGPHEARPLVGSTSESWGGLCQDVKLGNVGSYKGIVG